MPAIAISLAITAGGMAIQYLLRPKIKQTPTDKGKMDDVRVLGSGYGEFIPRTWGKTRISGNLVVSCGIDHYTTTTGGAAGGSKKARGASTAVETTHTYLSSFGILICRNPISEFLRIWADADLITNNAPVSDGAFQAESATLSGGASTSTSGTGWTGSGYVTNLGNGGKATFTVSSVTAPASRTESPGPTVAKTRIEFVYKSSSDMTVTIDSEDITAENHVFPSSGGLWTTYSCIITDFASTITYENASGPAPDLDKIYIEKFYEPVVDDNPPPVYRVSGIVNTDIEYPTNLNDPSAYYNTAASDVQNGTTGTYALTTPIPAEQIRFYTGTETQTADSKIQSWLDARHGTGEGVLRTSAMRGQSYVFFQDRTLKSNRVENFTFETDTGDATVNTILEDLFADVGLTSGYYTITATAGLDQEGFLEHTATSRKALIEALERYHFFRIGEIDGKITTILDDYDPSARLIGADLLRAHAYGEEMPAFDAEVVLKDEKDLPAEVRVSVMQPLLEYHNESVPARLFAHVSGKESVEYTFPIVDPAENARTVAEKLQLKAFAATKAFEFYAMPETAQWSIGDIIAVDINGAYQIMQIEKKQMTLPIGRIRFQCISVNSFTPTYYQTDTTEVATRATEQFVLSTFPRNSVVFVIQSDPIREADKGELGVYLAICGRGRGDGVSADLYREMDEDNYVLQHRGVESSLLGICEDTLATHAGGTATEDTTNVLDIWFFDDIDIETVTQTDIDRHPLINLIRVGSEWVQFRTATAQTLEDNSPYRCKWRISNLWRGKFDTSAAISTHAASEYACVVTPQMMFFPLEEADIGKTVSLKAVTAGQSVDVAPAFSFIFGSEAIPDAPTPLFVHTVNKATLTTSEETLLTDIIPANTLATNHDTITAEYNVYLANNTNAKTVLVVFAGTTIFTSFALDGTASVGQDCKITVTIERVNNTEVSCSSQLVTYTGTIESLVQQISVTGLTLTATDYELLLKADTPTAAGDVVFKVGHAMHLPAPPAANLTQITNLWAAFESDSYSFSDGTNVTGDWTDLTGNARHMTLSGTPTFETNEINGQPVIKLGADSTDKYTLPSMSAFTAGAITIVWKINDQTTYGGNDLGTSADVEHMPYSGTEVVYSDFGSTVRKTVGTLPVDMGTAHVIHIESASANWKLYQNGVLVYSTGTNTVGFPASPVIGYNSAQWMKASIAAIYVWNAVPTALNLQKVMRRIEQKYGVG